MNDVLNCLKTRRCVRSYKPEQISEAELDTVLEAGLFAASGMNRQAAVTLVIQDAELIEKLSRLNAEFMSWGGDPFFGAPTLIAVVADKNVRTYIEDGSLVIGNMMNAAHSIGLASCWVHRAREVFETEFGRKLLRSQGLGDEYVGIGNLVLGYSATELPEARPRREGRIIKL